jgi:hypothetical protein
MFIIRSIMALSFNDRISIISIVTNCTSEAMKQWKL